MLSVISRTAVKGLEGYSPDDLQEFLALVEMVKQEWVQARTAPAQLPSATDPDIEVKAPDPEQPTPLPSDRQPLSPNSPLLPYLKPERGLMPPTGNYVNGILQPARFPSPVPTRARLPQR